jgi:alanine-glyoxylate transaminase/serine-glyoxylate transaminase/serine-pyruvate transaminase
MERRVLCVVKGALLGTERRSCSSRPRTSLFFRPLSSINTPNLAASRHLALRAFRPSGQKTLANSRVNPRLSLVSRHFSPTVPLPALNTPFSTERTHSGEFVDDLEYTPFRPDFTAIHAPVLEKQTTKKINKVKTETKDLSDNNAAMSAQAPHPTLLIPGPIEFDDAVLQSMSHYA